MIEGRDRDIIDNSVLNPGMEVVSAEDLNSTIIVPMDGAHYQCIATNGCGQSIQKKFSAKCKCEAQLHMFDAPNTIPNNSVIATAGAKRQARSAEPHFNGRPMIHTVTSSMLEMVDRNIRLVCRAISPIGEAKPVIHWMHTDEDVVPVRASEHYQVRHALSIDTRQGVRYE